MINRIHIPDHLIKKLKNKKKLSAPLKEKFYWCLDMLTKNSKHPSLRNKTIKGVTGIWEFSINKNYRCIYRKEKDEAFILAIVKHEDAF
ncbi:MAG: cytotoxin [Candidatus Atribacteria bacterium]|nr:cytotoxin [Candidatus Atribacteria bacterium]